MDKSAQKRPSALPAPEEVGVASQHVYCDGAAYGDGERHMPLANIPAALGHPRVFLAIDPAMGFKDCPYCDRRFRLR